MNHEPMHQIFTRTAKRFNSATALSCGGRQISYAGAGREEQPTGQLPPDERGAKGQRSSHHGRRCDGSDRGDHRDAESRLRVYADGGGAAGQKAGGDDGRQQASLLDGRFKSASKLSEAVFAANHRARLISLDRDVEQSQLCAGVEYIGPYEQCEAEPCAGGGERPG